MLVPCIRNSAHFFFVHKKILKFLFLKISIWGAKSATLFVYVNNCFMQHKLKVNVYFKGNHWMLIVLLVFMCKRALKVFFCKKVYFWNASVLVPVIVIIENYSYLTVSKCIVIYKASIFYDKKLFLFGTFFCYCFSGNCAYFCTVASKNK